MKPSKIFLFFLPFLVFNLYADDVEIPAMTFGGGLNIKDNPTDIDDTETPDSANMINDIYGAAFKRNGSKRYISQAISSYPVTDMFRAYASTSTTFRKGLIVANKDSLYFSSQDVSPTWIQISSNLAFGQHYTFIPIQNPLYQSKVAILPQNLADPIKQFDIINASMSNLIGVDTTTVQANIRAKYGISQGNYLILGNCLDATLLPSTTYYPSRVYYSKLLFPSSFTAGAYQDVSPGDGESITGVSSLNNTGTTGANNLVHIWKETSISELSFTVLQQVGGDQSFTTKVIGFGLVASRTLASTGDGYIFGAKDGLRFWDGGRKSRLQVEQESRILSVKIKPIIDRCIKGGTWRNAVGKYYPKKGWYMLSIEDPDKLPRGANNTVLVFDFVSGNWYMFKNWLADSFSSWDGVGDIGQLAYGDSKDGYVHLVDNENFPNDSRKELVLDTMDSTASWIRGNNDFNNIIEGTGSVRINPASDALYASATLMAPFNFSTWHDGSKILKSDKISFKVYPSSLGNLSFIRLDLEVNDGAKQDFDVNFTSITISSNALTSGNTVWNTIEVPISSFPVNPAWIDLSTEAFPFAANASFYGIRIVSSGVAVSSISIDDLRLVQGTENPLNAYRYTKQFSFGTNQLKRFRQVILNRELGNDSAFAIDVFNDFGSFSRRINVGGIYPHELFVCGLGGTNSVTRMDSTDFSIKDTSSSLSKSAFDYKYGTSDQNYIYLADKTNDRILTIDRSSSGFSFIVSSFGSTGSGTTNFNTVQEMANDDSTLYVTDVNNHRIKLFSKPNLGFLTQFGTLGQSATSFHCPVGISVDERFIYVGNDGNSSIEKLSKSSNSLILHETVPLDMVAEMSLAVDQDFLYDAYNTISRQDIAMQDVVLEKRLKSDLKLVNRIFIKPQSNVSLSTYAIKGDISITDNFIFISFTDDANNDNSGYYIQKRLKSDFSIVKEFKEFNTHYTPISIGVSYKPKIQTETEDLNAEGRYLQLKYSESALDNSLKLFNQSFLLESEGIREAK